MTEGDTKRLSGMARLVLLRNTRRFLRFLDPAQRLEAEAIAKKEGCCFSAFGGYELAERQVGCFFAPGEEPDGEEYPVTCLKSAYDARFSSLSHRDVLGACMALGLTRDRLGDMIATDSEIYLFAETAIAPFLEENLHSAGKTALRFSEMGAGPVPVPAQKGSYFRAVLASLRFDAAVSGGYRLSRAVSQSLIRRGDCKLNFEVCERTDAQVSAGAMLSVRGMGRVRLASVDAVTRKDRVSVTFFRFE